MWIFLLSQQSHFLSNADIGLSFAFFELLKYENVLPASYAAFVCK